MTVEEIIKANEDAIDAGDFTTLISSIPYLDAYSWQALCDVLCMLRHVKVKPFCEYTPTGLTAAVVKGREVFRPTNKNIGALYTAGMDKATIAVYKPILEALGISIAKGLLKSSLGDPDTEVYLLYITKEGLKDKPQYWENVLGQKWEEIE